MSLTLILLDIDAGTRYDLRVRYITDFIGYKTTSSQLRTEDICKDQQYDLLQPPKTSQQAQSHPQLPRGHIWPTSYSDILAAQNEANQLQACVELAGVHRLRVKSYIRYVIPLVCVTSPQ
jgi:hypothetical protein